ncbi:MAG TPA: glycosyltransferase family 39 protein [Candidatus Nitrosocosmicus sp.]|nr:glycosyltransferase family 39 protein [Candidatus Nitrosocosmicus sp.]
MKNILKKELLILLGCIVLFLIIRSIHYPQHVNFSGDQGMFANKALELFRNKEITLIGPETSMRYESRVFYQGPATYYMLMFFLAIANWDPLIASYLFTIFASLMIIPLYFGVKKLINTKAAWVMVVIYMLAPYYVTYSRFLWNPTFQFSLVPLLIYCMGLYKENKKWWIFMLISILLGVLLHFHYQFVVIIAAIFIYYFLIQKEILKKIPLFLLGIALGASPMILFELRNDFYNMKTMLFLFEHKDKLDRGGGSYPHYYITLSFMTLLASLGIINKIIKYVRSKKISKKEFLYKVKGMLNDKTYRYVLGALFLFLLIRSLIFFTPMPRNSFWAGTDNWNYLDDYKIYEIVKKENLQNYNIANLPYDTLSSVSKFLLRKDGIEINDDYYRNKYLFVIYKNDNFMEATSYEVATFKPHKILKKWKINDHYQMFLLERLPSS